jgi:hypothetical protein
MILLKGVTRPIHITRTSLHSGYVTARMAYTVQSYCTKDQKQRIKHQTSTPPPKAPSLSSHIHDLSASLHALVTAHLLENT